MHCGRPIKEAPLSAETELPCMEAMLMFTVALWITASASSAPVNEPMPVLEHSDVVFMYGADADTYREYGCTVLAWGGTPTEESRAATAAAGVSHFGSVGMVTEFAQFIDRSPNYEEAICVDVHGERITVPWLWDHSHKGEPAYWFCTNQPLYREYLRSRVMGTAAEGVDGIHIDDHLGSSGALWIGACYCDRCAALFREFLATEVPEQRLRDAGIESLEGFDYPAVLRSWIAEHPNEAQQRWTWPLNRDFEEFQYRAAAEFMLELKALAAETAGRPLPMGANAGVPNIAHLSDYEALDLLSCEVYQDAPSLHPHSGVAFAYRMAEALHRPVAATASGQDWAFIAENGHEGLVRIWIAQAHALGHFFMAPHYQWCYTEEKGTHWYSGPAEQYAWLYRFIRDHARLLDGHQTVADVGVVVSAAAQREGRHEAASLASALADANVPFRVLLAGDAAVRAPLTSEELDACGILVSPSADRLAAADRDLLEARPLLPWTDGATIAGALERPVRVMGASDLWALPRRNPETGSVVIHLVNRDYDPGTNDVRPVVGSSLRVDPALAPPGTDRATLYAAGPNAMDPVVIPLQIEKGLLSASLPELGLWTLMELGEGPGVT